LINKKKACDAEIEALVGAAKNMPKLHNVEPGNGHVIQSSEMLRNPSMALTDKSSA
jgi:hypothetical protein